MHLNEARRAVRRRTAKKIPGETRQDQVQREVWILVEGAANGNGTMASFAIALGFGPSSLSNYLNHSSKWRSPKIAGALGELGVSCCPCGEVSCEGCAAGAKAKLQKGE